MAIKIEMLRCFVTVAAQGSLAEAASALGRTPSAVSMMLKQFEDHVGSPLFETARKSHLTPVGRLVLEEAARAVDQMERSVAVIEGLARSELGHLRLAATPSVTTAMLPAVITRFSREFPTVQIELRDMDSAAIARDLEAERADIGFGTLPEIEGMTRTELFSDAFGVVCRADHPILASGTESGWPLLETEPVIANGLSARITHPEFVPILARARLMVPNTASLLGLVREGVGVTVLPRLTVHGQRRDIAFLPLPGVAERRRVHVVARRPQRQLPAAREFMALLHALAAEGALIEPDIIQ